MNNWTLGCLWFSFLNLNFKLGGLIPGLTSARCTIGKLSSFPSSNKYPPVSSETDDKYRLSMQSEVGGHLTGTSFKRSLSGSQGKVSVGEVGTAHPESER